MSLEKRGTRVARRVIGVSDWMSDDDRSTRVQGGSCDRGRTEVRLSPEDSRSNVGEKGSSQKV